MGVFEGRISIGWQVVNSVRAENSDRVTAVSEVGCAKARREKEARCGNCYWNGRILPQRVMRLCE